MTIVFSPNGEPAYEVGDDAANTDEAVYSARGLTAPRIQAFAPVAASG